LASSQKLGRPVGLADPDWVRLTGPLLGKPTKRSVTIAGHETSISLEPMFWRALEEAASARQLPVNALIARIDVERLDTPGGAPNLTSAIRQWLFARAGGPDR
jgi:predicted DNA-binding ribbon-helix-helix protein